MYMLTTPSKLEKNFSVGFNSVLKKILESVIM